MKKILLVALTLIIAQQSFAQFNKGRILAGGSVGFFANSSKSRSGGTTTKTGSVSTVSFNPNVGYFLVDKVAVGASLLLSSSQWKGNGNNSTTNIYTSASFNPFVRYYLDQGIFFEGQFGFGTIKTKNKAVNPPTESTTSTYNWSLGAGYAYFLNDNVAVEPFVGFRSNGRKVGGTTGIENSLFLNVGLQVYLGARN